MVDSNAMRKTFVVPDIKPLDQYDLPRAKICASVGWLLAKSYGNAENVPVELRDPFYCDQYAQEHLKPPVTRLLLSPELYCRTYGLLLGGSPGAEGPPKDIPALLQVLGRKGLAPKDQNAPVTEAELQQKPIKMVSCLNYVQISSNKQHSTLSNIAVQHTIFLVQIRYRKDRMQTKLKPYFPVVNEVKDLSNGCAIAAVIHHYCPGLLRLEDACMKDSMSVADSLYNLQLIREFCDSCLKSCCPLELEDMLYSPAELKTNILSFLAELLYWFEVSKPEFVQPLQDSELTGSLTQSTSMSHVEAAGRTWTKKPLSRPLSSAVSFSIPFGLDSDVDIVMGNPVITRSVSSDNLNPAGQSMTHVPYTPPEDLKLPTIEEALQIIHNEEKMEPRLHPDGAPDGFYLHSPDDSATARLNGSPVTLSSSAPSRSGMLYHRSSGVPPEPSRTRHPSEGSRDDDSVLRDGSVDSDASEDLPKTHSTPATPASGPRITQPRGEETPDSGVRMTNFAKRKKKLVSEQESPSKSPALSTEMSELGARLEEKRKAIEAQKKRIEAIFAKHRQRLGKTAFLQLKKDEEHQEEEQLKKGPSVEEEGNIKPSVQQDHPVEKEKAGVGVPGGKGTAPLGDYNNAVSKLSAALNSLQNDMQRLSEQQNQLMKKKADPNNQAWVIPPSSKPSTPSRLSRESTRDLPSSAPPKSPKLHHHPRPAELKTPVSTRVITAPQSVDNLPHLRRVSQWQCRDQNSSSFSIGTSSQSETTSQTPAPRNSLIEISLSSLKALEGEEADQGQDIFSDSMSDQTEPETRGGVGFFFKDEARPEDEMERRRAALLEKQQKRAEEIKRRRQEQEREREARGEERPRTPSTPPPPRTPPPEGTSHRRGDFTRQEYERRHQLKIMEDLDKVLRQKPTTVRGVKKQRPKTVFRDDSDLSRSPAKGFMGSRLNKVYSHSTMNLSSVANDNGTLTVRKSPSRSHSPSRLRSPSRLAAQNGDWENASTISSPASIPEYTGKL
uniref:Calmodulin regulated spectrin-associated protein family, member 3 n=1 Tax=Cyprinus carpio TaxID=7962 RepID=A0A8C1KMM0_CYPCA